MIRWRWSRLVALTGTIAVFLGHAADGLGCNIPVFRYALERWQTDPLDAIIFYANDLAPDQRSLVEVLRAIGTEAGGHAPLQVSLVDLRQPLNDELRATWKRVENQADGSPLLVVQGKHPRGTYQCWASPLTADAIRTLIDSPARREISRRILSGDAIVWVVLRGADGEEARRTAELLRRESDRLAAAIELPEGIGLPGSELFSEIPLLVQFTVLEVDRHDPREAFLVQVLQGMRPAAFESGQPLVVPFFGRGRALEIIPADQLDAALVRDLARFLCGACSCQVKEQNPGFDLFFNVQWNRELFGEAGFQPPAAEGLLQRKSPEPTYVPIPSGRRGK
ncbi:MAG: hypothetical protein D6753_10135 [Planctomycetota bacterium]|nr:MAG: hypothetical protein D6753_10135 [Planctomycetota bacterium]